MKAKTVQLVQRVNGAFVTSEFAIVDMDAAMEARGFKPTGEVQPKRINERFAYREEIQGQPIFSGLAGPQYGGDGVVRYEDWEAYEVLTR